MRLQEQFPPMSLEYLWQDDKDRPTGEAAPLRVNDARPESGATAAQQVRAQQQCRRQRYRQR